MKPPLPRNLYTAAGVRELDRIAIEEKGLPGGELMERAGQAAFEVLRRTWPAARNVFVVCGAGNNGGDGFVLARLAAEAGLHITLLQLSGKVQRKGDALAAEESCRSAGLTPQPFYDVSLGAAEVIVDALLGTGLDRPLNEDWQGLLERINDAAAPVLALDVPSGLHADTGAAMPVAIRAHATVTFIGMKQGLLTAAGPAHCGELHHSDLGVPGDIYSGVPVSARRIDTMMTADFLPPRSRDTHKGQCGHVLIIGGDYGYAGAARLAGEAALRVGAGLVTVASRPEHALNIPLARPELMTLALASEGDLQPLLERVDVIAIGPGLGRSRWAASLLARVLQCRRPMVLDADALNLLALDPLQRGDWILTPHPGEAGRLLASPVPAIQADRFSAAATLQARYGGVCVLKGSGSLVVDDTGAIAVCHAGNPGMASGGMGDVLSGVIAGLLAQGLAPADAARVGVCLHSGAADLAAAARERGMLAGDLLPLLRTLANPAPYPPGGAEE